jgi:hypothetical protein
MSDRMLDHWPQTFTRVVGKAYGLPTAPENRWHRPRRLSLSIPRLLCQDIATRSNNREEGLRSRRSQSPGDTRHPDHTRHEGS